MAGNQLSPAIPGRQPRQRRSIAAWLPWQLMRVPLNAKVRMALSGYIRARSVVENDHLFLDQRNEGIQSKTI
jgi:hypothetical protein